MENSREMAFPLRELLVCRSTTSFCDTLIVLKKQNKYSNNPCLACFNLIAGVFLSPQKIIVPFGNLESQINKCLG